MKNSKWKIKIVLRGVDKDGNERCDFTKTLELGELGIRMAFDYMKTFVFSDCFKTITVKIKKKGE